MSARLRGSTVSARKKATFAATFAGERIALYRGASGDGPRPRRLVRPPPGDAVRCCYRAWSCRGNARISQIPYLSKSAGRPPCVSEELRELSVLACDPGRGPPR